jgi:hypothetical protein
VHVEVIRGLLAAQVLLAEQEERDSEADENKEAAKTREDPAKHQGLVPAAISLYVFGQDTVGRDLKFCLTL